jgi:hypothetical protein
MLSRSAKRPRTEERNWTGDPMERKRAALNHRRLRAWVTYKYR